MRRFVVLLAILALAIPILGGCSCRTRCDEIRYPCGMHTYVVDQCCYPIDENGNRVPQNP